MRLCVENKDRSHFLIRHIDQPFRVDSDAVRPDQLKGKSLGHRFSLTACARHAVHPTLLLLGCAPECSRSSPGEIVQIAHPRDAGRARPHQLGEINWPAWGRQPARGIGYLLFRPCRRPSPARPARGPVASPAPPAPFRCHSIWRKGDHFSPLLVCFVSLMFDSVLVAVVAEHHIVLLVFHQQARPAPKSAAGGSSGNSVESSLC